MNGTRLQRLLRAKRDDLLDGFPVKLALKALSAEGDERFKHAYLNQLLEPYRICLNVARPEADQLDQFKRAGIISAVTYSDGGIDVNVSRSFYKVACDPSPLERAFRFQGLVAHELVHRKQFKDEDLHGDSYRTDDSDLSTFEYLNDPLELEAMAAEIAHDMSGAKFLGDRVDLTSPRLVNLTAFARNLLPESICTLNRHVTSFLTPVHAT